MLIESSVGIYELLKLVFKVTCKVDIISVVSNQVKNQYGKTDVNGELKYQISTVKVGSK